MHANMMMMNEHALTLFTKLGISNLETDHFIPREQLLNDQLYNEIKILIPDLKKQFSSSKMNSLQQNAEKEQRWPLLNLTRQLLQHYGYKMEPVRKSDGYTLDGVKKYKRYFHVVKTVH